MLIEHWKQEIIKPTTPLPLMGPQVVVITTHGTTRDEKAANSATPCHQWEKATNTTMTWRRTYQRCYHTDRSMVYSVIASFYQWFMIDFHCLMEWEVIIVLFLYSDVIMSAMASQIIGVSIVCSIVCSGIDQRKHQSSASLAFVRGIHRWPVASPHKGPVTRKMFPFDDIIMHSSDCFLCIRDQHLAINFPADVLIKPGGAWPSTNTVMTVKLDMLFLMFFWFPVTFCDQLSLFKMADGISSNPAAHRMLRKYHFCQHGAL